MWDLGVGVVTTNHRNVYKMLQRARGLDELFSIISMVENSET
jgi:hypothetical protein